MSDHTHHWFDSKPCECGVSSPDTVFHNFIANEFNPEQCNFCGEDIDFSKHKPQHAAPAQPSAGLTPTQRAIQVCPDDEEHNHHLKGECCPECDGIREAIAAAVEEERGRWLISIRPYLKVGQSPMTREGYPCDTPHAAIANVVANVQESTTADSAREAPLDQETQDAIRNIMKFRPEPEEVTDADLEKNRPSYNFPNPPREAVSEAGLCGHPVQYIVPEKHVTVDEHECDHGPNGCEQSYCALCRLSAAEADRDAAVDSEHKYATEYMHAQDRISELERQLAAVRSKLDLLKQYSDSCTREMRLWEARGVQVAIMDIEAAIAPPPGGEEK